MELTKPRIDEFLTVLLGYYDGNGRHDLPWRQTADPYRIVVSELMLQQTQVKRVIPKYLAFLERFPTVEDLATASLGDVLIAWQGLGYNRRAQYLWRAAQAVRTEFGGRFPDTLEGLVKLPGIGRNTAGAVLAYAYHQPALFIETNIRTVIIHHFFHDRTDVSDTEILHILKQILGGFEVDEGKEQPDKKSHLFAGAMRKTAGLSHYRDFYWAMMDYGSYLKQSTGNNIGRSKHYVRQSRFAGSRRQIRGAVIRSLSTGPQTEEDVLESINDERLTAVLEDLVREGLIVRHGGHIQLA